MKQDKVVKSQRSATQIMLIKQKDQQKTTNLKSKTPAKTLQIKNTSNKSPNKTQVSSFYNKKSLKEQLQFYLQTVTKSKSNLCNCLQLCKLIETSHQEQRCLEHNNTLTLYCITQRKLICVNCIYGVHKHRTHRILPMKDNIEFVIQDNKSLKIKLDKELNALDNYIQSSRKNTALLQQGLKKSLLDIQTQFRKARQNLQKSFDREKINALKRYEELIQKSQEVSGRLQELKYTIWQSVSKYNFNKPKIDQSEQIGKQLIFSKVLQSINVSCRQITQQQLQKLYQKKSQLTILSPQQILSTISKSNFRANTSVSKGKKQ